MKRFGSILIAAGLVAMGAHDAAAADFKPVVKARPAAVPVPMAYNWTGFYVGINAGGIWGRSRYAAYDGLLYPPLLLGGVPLLLILGNNGTLPATSANNTSWVAGGQTGYNWEVNQFLIGIEADAVRTGLRMTGVSTATRFPGTTAVQTQSAAFATDIDWMVSLRLRLGFVADRALFYVTGGAAVADIDINSLVTLTNGPGVLIPAGTFGLTTTTSTRRAGWTVGAGIEWAFDNNWSIAGEYRHFDFGRVGTTFAIPSGLPAPDATFATGNTSARVTADQATVRLNYRFGGAPVVARY